MTDAQAVTDEARDGGGTLTPGRRLDARVARALGWTEINLIPNPGNRHLVGRNPQGRASHLPCFSTDEGDAVRAFNTFPAGDYVKRAVNCHTVRIVITERLMPFCTAETFCLAVCGAILAAKGEGSDAR